MEGLLLDRCRTHINIHFHHRVVAMKVAIREAISSLLGTGTIGVSSFTLDALLLRDDPWLWSELRKLHETGPPQASVQAALRALLYRDKSAMTLFWRNRLTYRNWNEQLLSEAGLRELALQKLDRNYEHFISGKLGVDIRVFWLNFRPVEPTALPLTDENGDKPSGELLDVSNLTNVLNEIWDGEPHYFVVALGNASAESIRSDWIRHTADWLCRGSS
jgi:hypothetical protein